MFVSPVASFALGVVSIICTAVVLAVALQTRRKLRLECSEAVADARQEAMDQVRTHLGELGQEILKLQGQVRELEEHASLVSGVQAKSWTNINGRMQALRMIRNGSTSDRVAAELSMTPGEVDLIRRVQQLTNAAV